jgi:hypothetical protein
MSEPIKGQRVPDETEPHTYASGDYGRWRGSWYVRPPANAEGRSAVGAISKHTVVEHEDGSITVDPSILQYYGEGDVLYHGFLQNGMWRATA